MRHHFLSLLLLCTFALLSNALLKPSWLGKTHRGSRLMATKSDNMQYDSQGYLIKPREWFAGLSLDPGASLTDPRAVPPQCKEYADNVRNGGKVKSFADTIKLIDENYEYFSVPFKCGDVNSPPNQNLGSAKILSFGLMTGLDVAATLRLYGEIYDSVLATPGGTDHPIIRSFMKVGWQGVTFSTGLAIVSKLQAYDDTDSAFATQASIQGKGTGWDKDSDSWIP